MTMMIEVQDVFQDKQIFLNDNILTIKTPKQYGYSRIK